MVGQMFTANMLKVRGECKDNFDLLAPGQGED